MIYIFDLDETIFESRDKHGNQIWAKQLVHPLNLVSSDELIDDVFSTCKLRSGVRNFLDLLRLEKASVGFISNGRELNVPDDYQPSLSVLKKFEIYDHFTFCKVLQYKTDSKLDAVLRLTESIKNCTFYDDDTKVINELVKANIRVINSKTKDWLIR